MHVYGRENMQNRKCVKAEMPRVVRKLINLKPNRVLHFHSISLLVLGICRVLSPSLPYLLSSLCFHFLSSLNS